MAKQWTIDEIIKEVRSKARGRTRYAGQEPFWDEMMVAEIERLRREVEEWRTAAVEWRAAAGDFRRLVERTP